MDTDIFWYIAEDMSYLLQGGGWHAGWRMSGTTVTNTAIFIEETCKHVQYMYV